MAHDVFISYSNKDKAISDAVCAKLEECKIRCWIAPRDVPAGQNFAESIIEAIDTCKVFVLIWSASTNASEHILNEINRAFDQGITIIPFRIQDVQPTRAMSYYFGRTHWLDALTPPLEKHIAILAETIQSNLGRKVVSQAGSVQEKQKKEEIIPPIKPVIKVETKGMEKKKAGIVKQQPQSRPVGKKVSLLPITAGLLVVTVLVVLFASGVFKRSISNLDTLNTQRALILTVPPPTATMTNISTITPAWVKEFAEPILAAIQNQVPVFQDDFSTTRSDWTIFRPISRCSKSVASITEGRMTINIEPMCNNDSAYIDKKGLPKNLVLQVDLFFHDSIQVSPVVRFILLSGIGQNLFTVSKEGEWRVIYCISGGDCENIKKSGYASFDSSKPVTLIIICRGKERAIYLNSSPSGYFIDNEGHGTVMSLLALGGENQQAEKIAFDNFKIWDLDKIKNLPAVSS